MDRYARCGLLGLSLTLSGVACAGDVEILAAEFTLEDTDRYTVQVSLRHDDTGWAHYADRWRVVDGDGQVLGERVLLHPHVDEQPFRRALSGVRIPAATANVFIEAHDKVHGWARTRLAVDPGQLRDGHLVVEAR